MDKFLQRRGILDFQDADTKAFNHYLTALRSGFFCLFQCRFQAVLCGFDVAPPHTHLKKCKFSQYRTKRNAIFTIFAKTSKNKLWIPYCRHIG